MHIAVQQRREVTLTLPYPGAVSLAGSATVAGAVALGVWRWRQQHVARQIERWLRESGQ